ncbi:hypothetical protein AB205_0087280 [Aquarana catesbeiana]|uniref:Uncharacterized protein n=1 Tax=Aquarana catesbeiana TaxID=8400 RepID=A0A2G9QA45_AQUCT|nr:hypothetical protein AB205_0087280 [Aquarana catesbeiana]
MPVYHKKGYFYCPKKNVIPKICCFVQKPFSKRTCECAQSKNVSIQQCVASSFNDQ